MELGGGRELGGVLSGRLRVGFCVEGSGEFWEGVVEGWRRSFSFRGFVGFGVGSSFLALFR